MHYHYNLLNQYLSSIVKEGEVDEDNNKILFDVYGRKGIGENNNFILKLIKPEELIDTLIIPELSIPFEFSTNILSIDEIKLIEKTDNEIKFQIIHDQLESSQYQIIYTNLNSKEDKLIDYSYSPNKEIVILEN